MLARGVEHIGVPYSHDSMVETVRWTNLTCGDRPYEKIVSRGRWLALAFSGIVALAWPLSVLFAGRVRTAQAWAGGR